MLGTDARFYECRSLSFNQLINFRSLENQLISNNRKQIIQRYSTDELDEGLEYQTTAGQTVLTPAAKKQGIETLVIDNNAVAAAPGGQKLPSIIQCVNSVSKSEAGGRVEVETIPRISDLPLPPPDPTQTQTELQIANVQDPETGVTR